MTLSNDTDRQTFKDRFSHPTFFNLGAFLTAVVHPEDFMRRFIAFLFVLSLSCFASSVQAKKAVSECPVKDREIKIDGDAVDWFQHLNPLKGDKITWGSARDEKFLYLVLRVPDKGYAACAQKGGLTVWFDPQGGKKKFFGIRFPSVASHTGGVNPGSFQNPPKPGENNPPPAATQTDRPSLGSQPLALEFVDKGGNSQRPSPDVLASSGVEAKTSTSNGVFTCEMKLTLGGDPKTPFSISLGPEKILGIGFISDKPEETSASSQQGGSHQPPSGSAGGSGNGSMPPPPPGGNSGGNMSGGPGGTPQGSQGVNTQNGQGQSSSASEDIESFKVWTKIKITAQ